MFLSLWLLPCFLLPCNVLCQRLKQRKVHIEGLYNFNIPSMQKTLWTSSQRLSNSTSLWSYLLELFTPKAFYICGCTTQFFCCSGGEWSLLNGEVQSACREHMTVAALATAVYRRGGRTQQILPTTCFRLLSSSPTFPHIFYLQATLLLDTTMQLKGGGFCPSPVPTVSYNLIDFLGDIYNQHWKKQPS